MNEIIKKIYESINLDEKVVGLHTMSGIVILNESEISVTWEAQNIVCMKFLKNQFVPTTDIPIVYQHNDKKHILKYHFYLEKGHYFECLA